MRQISSTRPGTSRQFNSVPLRSTRTNRNEFTVVSDISIHDHYNSTMTYQSFSVNPILGSQKRRWERGIAAWRSERDDYNRDHEPDQNSSCALNRGWPN